MPENRYTEEDHLEELRRLAGRAEELLEEFRLIRMRRDLLILALFRRGVSLRTMARASGIHYTRVRQLIAESVKTVERTDLSPAQPRKGKRVPKKGSR
jgi:hypothetical protein